MKNVRRNDEGMALIFSMIAIIIIAGLLATVMVRMQAAKNDTDEAVDIIVLEEAAQSGIDMAVKELWRSYIDSRGNTTGNWASYRSYLDNVLQIPINEDLNFNGQKDVDEVGNGNGQFETLPAGMDQRGMLLFPEPRDIVDPATGHVQATLSSVHVARYDQAQVSWLTVRATASIGDKQKTAVQVFEIGADSENLFQFAFITNNATCIFCHADIKSLPLEYNNNPDHYGNFDRVKIASLESLLIRENEADSTVAGSTYTRGKVYKKNGSTFTANSLASADFKAANISDENGKISQDNNGNMTMSSLQNAGLDGNGHLEQFASLYMDYPLDPDEQTDGPLPQSFPPPYPDVDEDRYVDDDEFDSAVQSATGSIQFEYGVEDTTGSVSAGVAYGVPHGSFYAGSELPTSSNAALNELSSTGVYEGNLILVGTDDDPILINKTVAVDGDVIIKGKVKGDGVIYARGNAYIIGDTTYADDVDFGVNDQGKQNAFALVAGGNIMMGDYLTVRGVNHSKKTNDLFPDSSKYSIHYREEHKSGNVSVSGKTENLEYGYFDPYSVDAGEEVPGRQGQQYSFTQSELTLFNKLELDRAVADSTYTPRFYGLREGQPDNIYIWDTKEGGNQEHSVTYVYNGVNKLADYIVKKGYPESILTRATYQYLNPQGNWMSEDSLRQFWFDDEMARSRGDEFKFDGLMYSNNSIFAIVASMARHKSNKEGKMTIRGGIVSSDLGIFSPGGLEFFYDPRVERFLTIRNEQNVTLARAAFYFE